MSDIQGLDEGYLDWLYGLVAPRSNLNPGRTYFLLLEQLFVKDFRWYVPNDDNRAEDGKELRQEFLYDFDVDNRWQNAPCSVLEMLIALGRRLAFIAGGDSDEWFWKLIENLGLRNYRDDTYDDGVSHEVDHILETLLEREYGHNGDGGLFPLNKSNSDQTEIEIWYQMSAYLLEQGI